MLDDDPRDVDDADGGRPDGAGRSGSAPGDHPPAGLAASTPPEWVRCPACQAGNVPDAHYCEKCGTELANPDAATLLFDPRGGGGRRSAQGAGGSDAEAAPGALPWVHVVSRTSADALLQLARRELTDDYDVQREIGRGGMAVVYLAVEHQLRRNVALKILPPELALGPSVVERFKREAQMAAALDHPNIIPIYRVGEAPSLLYLAMKYVEGRALDGIVADQGALPISVVLLVLRAATDALTYAHEHGIVHRDIKGGNVLIDREGRVIVTDFGVARAIENASMTTTGSVIGTPYFMSPEQCAGKIARPQSDQYSLGVVAFQMLTGAVPFQADTLAAIMHHHFFTPVPDVSVARHDAPPELIAVLNRVLSKDPERRYATTRDMRAAVAAVPLSDADRADGEAMLRTLAQGAAVPTVRTEALPPLADTMTVVAAHDAFMRSADRVRRVRRRIGSTSVLVAVCAVAIWLWLRPAPGAARPATGDASLQPVAASPPAAAPGVAAVGGAAASGAAPGGRAPGNATATEESGTGIASGHASSGRHHPIATPPAPAPVTPPALSAAPVDTVIPTGKLRVRALPSGADISIDGQVVGEGAVFDLDLPAGARRLRIAAPGYVDFDTTFVVVAGQTTQLSRITLKGSDER